VPEIESKTEIGTIPLQPSGHVDKLEGLWGVEIELGREAKRGSEREDRDGQRCESVFWHWISFCRGVELCHTPSASIRFKVREITLR